MIQGLAFDLDGVILDSVAVKTEAFRRVFAAYPQHLDAILRLHVENIGTSRYEKFRRIHRDLLRVPLLEAEMDRLDREFTAFVTEAIGFCSVIPGAREFLEHRAVEYPLFLVSSTPERDLPGILERHGMAGCFSGVYGSPCEKAQALRALVVRLGAKAGNVLFIGDAAEDQRAALEAGVQFIGRVDPGMTNPFEDPRPRTVGDFWELEAIWPEVTEAEDGAAAVKLVVADPG